MNDYKLTLEDVISNIIDHTIDPARPFSGQPQTYQGERGKTEVRGIRFRDLADCAVRAFVRCSDPNMSIHNEMKGREGKDKRFDP